MQHNIPLDAKYACPSLHCNAKLKLNSIAPDDSLVSDATRRQEQRKHFGGVPWRAPNTSISLEDFSIDTLHLIILRVDSLPFLRTVQANCNDATQEKGAQWLYEKCDIIINDKVAL
jgi:hypothetical protein